MAIAGLAESTKRRQLMNQSRMNVSAMQVRLASFCSSTASCSENLRRDTREPLESLAKPIFNSHTTATVQATLLVHSESQAALPWASCACSTPASRCTSAQFCDILKFRSSWRSSQRHESLGALVDSISTCSATSQVQPLLASSEFEVCIDTSVGLEEFKVGQPD